MEREAWGAREGAGSLGRLSAIAETGPTPETDNVPAS